MRLSEYASTRKTRGSYKMPRSVQQSIPIDRIYADGVWQSENVFSLMWQISDINYAMQSDAAKQNILTQLGTVYAGIPADCWMQVCIVSQRMDEKAFARDVLYHRENDGFDALRAERNRQIKANARENGNVVQHKYIIVSTNKPGVKEARERFVQVQGHTHIKRYIDQGIPPICHCLPVSLNQHWVVPFKYTNGSGWDSNRDRFSNQCHRTDTNWQVNATKRACLSGRGYCPNAVHQPAGSLYTVQHNNGFPCAAYRYFNPSQQGQL